MSRRAAPSAARTRGAPSDIPLIVVEPALDDEHAANLATLRRHWKWAAFSQFFYTFAPLFAMPDVALADIEDDLARGSALYLPRVVHRLLHVLTQDRKLSIDNWQTVLRRQYLRRDPELNPLGPEPVDSASKVSREPTETREIKDEDTEGMDVDTVKEPDSVPQNDAIPEGNSEMEDKPATEAIKGETADIEEPTSEEALVDETSRDWFDLSMLAKLDSLHLLTEWQFNNPHRVRTTMRSDGDYAEWRIEPIGYDAKTNAYWLIGPDRLWIQRVPPRPASSKRKRKPNTTKANGKASTSKTTTAKNPVSESEADAVPTKRARAAKGRSSRTRNDPPAQSSTGRGTRAAKLQANEKLDAQKRQMEEFQRQKLAETRSSRSLRNKSRAPPSSSKNVLLGTRASARLRGAVRDDDDEWQEIPEEWLSETHDSDAKPRTRSNGRPARPSRKGKARAQIVPPSSEDEESDEHPEAVAARTGLESGDDISDLTELSDDQEDAKSEAQPTKQDESTALGLSDEAAIPPPEQRPEDKAKVPPNEEAGPQLPADFIEWEAICITLAEWEEITERFSKATHYLEKALHKMLQQIAPEIIDELKEAERKRTIEEAIVHRKRSSRIAIKESEKEEARKAALKKAEEDEKQARTRRLEARAKKEESEREKRERARELRRLEREERDSKGQDRKTSAAPTISASVTSVRSSMQPSRNNTPSGVRTPDWTLDCELCGMCGVNMDEGAPMVSCGICSRWQHINCHDRDDARAGRAARNWEAQPFYCKRCKPVAEQRLANGTRHSGGAERRNHGSRSHHTQSHSHAASQKVNASVTPYYPYPQTSDPRYQQPMNPASSSAYGLPHSPVHGNSVPQPNASYSRSHRTPGTIAFSHYQPDQHGFTRSPYANGYANGMQPQPQPTQYTQPYMANGGYGGNPAYQVPLQQSYSRGPDVQHHMSQGSSSMGAGWGGMNQGHGHYPSSAARGNMNQYNAADSYGYAHASTNGQQSWPSGPYQHTSNNPLPPNMPSNAIPPSIPTHPHQHQQPLGNGAYHYPSS